jgi:hypothetical protein
MPSLTLRAILPEKNLDRDYTICIQKGLFGLWVLNIFYGKWGAGCRKLQYSFEKQEEAQDLIKKTLRKRLTSQKRIGCNYQPVETTGSTKDLEFWFGNVIGK